MPASIADVDQVLMMVVNGCTILMMIFNINCNNNNKRPIIYAALLLMLKTLMVCNVKWWTSSNCHNLHHLSYWIFA